MDEGNYDEARPLLEESLSLSREIGDPGGVGVASGNLATIAKYQEDHLAARSGYEGALAAFREQGDLANVASTLFDLGAALTRLGERASGRERLIECLTLSRELGEKRIAAYAFEAVADHATTWGDPNRAVRLLGAASAIRLAIGAPLTPNESKQRAVANGQTRSRLSRARFDSEWKAGARMSFEAALEYGLESLAAVDLEEDAMDRPTIARADTTAVLLERAQKGDRNAGDQLARRLLPVLTRWAHGRLPAGARGMIDTDDLVQDTVVHAFRRLGTFEMRGEGALVAYLRKALVNRIRDAARPVVHKSGRMTEDLVDRGPSPLQEVIGRGTLESYEAALSGLTETQRQSIILRVEMGYTYRQVADAVGARSANAVRMSVSRGIQRMAKLMSAEEGP
jgi:RNA polymerase sigma-70 factor (ECF subfamily)